MPADVASSGFADHALIVERIHGLTVAQAKDLLKDLNREPSIACGHLAVSGNKPELLNRLIEVVTNRKIQGDIRGFQKFRTLLDKYKSTRGPTSAYRNG